MNASTFHRMTTATVQSLRDGGLNAYDIWAERAISDGHANPCLHCMRHIPKGVGMLIFAHRPFTGLHPYAETGPVFICEDTCTAHGGGATPQILNSSPDFLLKGYTANERIHYGTGKIVEAEDIAAYAGNNCFQLRITRRV
jgi:hypothetical protein